MVLALGTCVALLAAPAPQTKTVSRRKVVDVPTAKAVGSAELEALLKGVVSKTDFRWVMDNDFKPEKSFENCLRFPKFVRIIALLDKEKNARGIVRRFVVDRRTIHDTTVNEFLDFKIKHGFRTNYSSDPPLGETMAGVEASLFLALRYLSVREFCDALDACRKLEKKRQPQIERAVEARGDDRLPQSFTDSLARAFSVQPLFEYNAYWYLLEKKLGVKALPAHSGLQSWKREIRTGWREKTSGDQEVLTCFTRWGYPVQGNPDQFIRQLRKLIDTHLKPERARQ